MDYQLEAMCFSVGDLEAMRAFYAGVFGIDFTMQEVQGQSLYTGSFSGLELTLVPVALTGVEPGRNPTHYDVYVSDLEEGIARVERHGGRTNERLGEDDHVRAIGIFDPDGNFMVLKQRKASTGRGGLPT